MRRRTLLAATPALLALQSGCERRAAQPLAGGWIGARAERGHLLRDAQAREPLLRAAAATRPKRTETLIVGGGVSGLACARRLAAAGRDFALLELEDETGGNARGHRLGGMACPLGAHYLPTPGPEAPEVAQLLDELGVARQQLGRTVYDERMLCHSPQERLFYQGQWHEGLLPPADSAERRAHYLRFGAAVAKAQRELGFAMPAHRARWTSGHAALDAQPFSHWLDAQGLSEPGLRWYLDYCCRDDYGAGSATVSAWAGLHYFASRHGFHGGEAGANAEELDAVLTWPEGNAWLTRQMAAPLAPQLLTGRVVLQAEIGRHEVSVLAWNAASQQAERWTARQLVMAVPLFIAARLLSQPPEALRQLVRVQQHAPWLVANLQLSGPLLGRLGAQPSWDNVSFGSEQLGYVDAGHQRLDPRPGPTVLSSYWALPQAERAGLLSQPWQHWAERVLAPLQALHPDLRDKLVRIELMRWGHAMSIPTPGLRGSSSLAALRSGQHGQARLHFAHSDLAGYSVFEEAFTAGVAAAERVI
ncbi:FAD-dependent oxidoreductase [Paucibacter sp. APW11]|uniref:FAD-dependent oxidoreductase n=1 Tax=Roseateles aquae TaxID=3077235 RepID=A0ABU3PD16_9BURK|nr:FAD-dependent oxidoreductase [Paucibacter sp. APW11]MDT9000419.1 FAD-dependent oxidoreductase [Paucibacter sp. APW11]